MRTEVTHSRKEAPSSWGAYAFTLIELLVVGAVLTCLGLSLMPALAKTQPASRASKCLHNARQLAMAIAIYTEDSNQLFPPNPDDGNTVKGHNWCGGAAGKGDAEEFNTEILADSSRSLLARYLGGKIDLFRCPSDLRRGLYRGSNPARAGTVVPCARSVSMNGGVGTICKPYEVDTRHGGKPYLSTNGRTLNGTFNHRRDTPWATFGKTTDFRLARPAQIFLLADDNPESLNDAALMVSAGLTRWIDCPGSSHQGACTFAFCDGHTELHRWKGQSLILNGTRIPGSILNPSPDYDDWTWLRDHATVQVQ